MPGHKAGLVSTYKKEEPMRNLQLKIIHTSSGHAGSPRLCEHCAHGLVLQGEGMNFAWCGYMSEYVSVGVESCNRYQSERSRVAEDSVLALLSHYTLD